MSQSNYMNQCDECGTNLEQSGRLTWYCPTCDVCPECLEPQADGAYHEYGCSILAQLQRDELWMQLYEIDRLIGYYELRGVCDSYDSLIANWRDERKCIWRKIFPIYWLPLTHRAARRIKLRRRPSIFVVSTVR